MFPKPGYSVEVRDDKGEGMDVSMFGLPPADDWVLHGPYVDKSMLRNALAYWLFRQAGRYAPRTKHFDLYIKFLHFVPHIKILQNNLLKLPTPKGVMNLENSIN